jgi:threonine-phosphate decarboxylase
MNTPKQTLDFSTNLFRHTDQTELIQYLSKHTGVIEHDAEEEAAILEQMIASELDISAECVLVTAGINDAIYRIANLFIGCVSVIPQPTYRIYEEACRVNNHIITYYKRKSIKDRNVGKVFWLCNPNNPSGMVLNCNFIYYIAKRYPNDVFIVDQTYENYTKAPMLKPKNVQNLDNLIMLHSLTNKYGVRGLLLGYITAPPALIRRLRTVRQEGSIGLLTLEAGKYLIRRRKPAVADLDAYLNEARRMRLEINAIEGLRVFDSQTNFMLVHMERPNSTLLKQYLLENHGMLIYDCSVIGGLDNHYFRVSAQTREEDDALLHAIKEYLEL